MTKITKKAKKIIAYKVPVITYKTIYKCPACHTSYEGFINLNTSRFICECGQELVVKEWMRIEE